MQRRVKVYSYAQCVGAVLRYFRETRGRSIGWLAEQLDCTESWVTQIEHGYEDRGPSFTTLLRWSAATKVPLGHVFTLADRVRFGMGHGTHCLDSGWGTGDRETVRCTVEELVKVARKKNDDTIRP